MKNILMIDSPAGDEKTHFPFWALVLTAMGALALSLVVGTCISMNDPYGGMVAEAQRANALMTVLMLITGSWAMTYTYRVRGRDDSAQKRRNFHMSLIISVALTGLMVVNVALW